MLSIILNVGLGEGIAIASTIIGGCYTLYIILTTKGKILRYKGEIEAKNNEISRIAHQRKEDRERYDRKIKELFEHYHEIINNLK